MVRHYGLLQARLLSSSDVSQNLSSLVGLLKEGAETTDALLGGGQNAWQGCELGPHVGSCEHVCSGGTYSLTAVTIHCPLDAPYRPGFSGFSDFLQRLVGQRQSSIIAQYQAWSPRVEADGPG